MPPVELTPLEIDFDTFIDLTTQTALYAANEDGAFFTWGAKTILAVWNNSAGIISVIVDNADRCSMSVTPADHDETLAIPANQKIALIDTTPERFRDVDGYVNITYSAHETFFAIPVKILGQP